MPASGRSRRRPLITCGSNISTTGFCSGPLLGPQQWRPLLVGFPHVERDDIISEAYKNFFASPALEDRKAAWNTIEQRTLDQAYMIKVADLATVRAYDTKYDGVKPYYFPRFWNVWLK